MNKEKGLTSHDMLRSLKQQGAKIGHTGTLDRFAEGLMLILAGPSRALATCFQGMDKEYIARICFGQETDTLDCEGEIIERKTIPSMTTIQEILPQFIGRIQQRVPAFSAVHIDGERAWKRTRRGEIFEMPSREIEIYDIELLEYHDGILLSRCRVSKGTYIRALWRDIARCCGSCAHLLELYRTQVGAFHAHNAQKVDENLRIIPPGDFIKDIPNLNICYANKEGEKRIRNGKEVTKDMILQIDAERFNVCCNMDGDVLARISLHNNAIRYKFLQNLAE